MSASYIERPKAFITSRIEFVPTPPTPLPSITPRIEFTSERLSYVTADEGQQSSTISTSAILPGSSRRVVLPPLKSRKIPKPVGEPGRPDSGGYSIEKVLIDMHKWSKEDVDALTDTVRMEARKHLDMTLSFRSQKSEKITDICKRMSEDQYWPQLKDYDKHWPVRSMLKLTLKYRSEAARRATTKATNVRLRAALRGSSPESV